MNLFKILLKCLSFTISCCIFTIFLNFSAFNKTVNIKGTQYELLLVDTAGQDEYSMFPAEYSVDVNGYVLVYSIDSVHSFEVCKSIHEKLMDLVGGCVPIILVGNKTDLHVDRRVTQAQGKALAEEMKAVFIETSAKENQVGSIHISCQVG